MSHISFSELKNWSHCAHYHKLVHIDKLKGFAGNAYTAFGTAIHDVCETAILANSPDDGSMGLIFEKSFLRNLQSLPKDIKNNLDRKMIMSMREQATKIIPEVLPAVEEYFGSYTVVSTEEKIYVPIGEYAERDFSFKGFIDLVVQTDDGKYHIIDWKTCSWGWDSKKKSEPMTTYQLTFYKHYFAIKHGIDPSDIECHFALLKRTAKKNKVEFFRVTSGKKKTDNAIKLLVMALYNITNKKYTKNKLACHGQYGDCEFYNTEHCR